MNPVMILWLSIFIILFLFILMFPTKYIVHQSNVHMNAQRKPSVSAARQSRRPLDEYSESEREESEYESDGAEVDRSPPHARDEPDHEDEYEEEADEEAADAISPSEGDEDEVRYI